MQTQGSIDRIKGEDLPSLSLTSVVERKLEHMILTGEMQPGERLNERIDFGNSSITVVRSFGPGPSITSATSRQSPSASRVASPKRVGTEADCAPRP